MKLFEKNQKKEIKRKEKILLDFLRESISSLEKEPLRLSENSSVIYGNIQGQELQEFLRRDISENDVENLLDGL